MKKYLLIAMIAMVALCLVACAAPQTVPEDTPEPEPQQLAANVMTLKGPTGVAMAFMAQDDTVDSNYQYALAATPEEVVAAISSGQADIAAMPTNLAAKLYAKTDGDLQMLAVIASGSLYLLENGDTVNSLADLAGKTVYATGQGANPQYILEALLRSAGLEPGVDVEIVYKAEHAELATLLAAGEVELAMLPEPNVSAVLAKNDSVRVALDLNEQWQNATGGDLTMSCVAATKTFAQAHPQVIADFLSQMLNSVTFANSDNTATAQLCVDLGYFDNAAVIESAIPRMGLTYVDGAELPAAAAGYLQMLYDADPASVGGAMPEQDFYYSK